MSKRKRASLILSLVFGNLFLGYAINTLAKETLQYNYIAEFVMFLCFCCCMIGFMYNDEN